MKARSWAVPTPLRAKTPHEEQRPPLPTLRREDWAGRGEKRQKRGLGAQDDKEPGFHPVGDGKARSSEVIKRHHTEWAHEGHGQKPVARYEANHRKR